MRRSARPRGAGGERGASVRASWLESTVFYLQCVLCESLVCCSIHVNHDAFVYRVYLFGYACVALLMGGGWW